MRVAQLLVPFSFFRQRRPPPCTPTPTLPTHPSWPHTHVACPVRGAVRHGPSSARLARHGRRCAHADVTDVTLDLDLGLDPAALSACLLLRHRRRPPGAARRGHHLGDQPARAVPLLLHFPHLRPVQDVVGRAGARPHIPRPGRDHPARPHRGRPGGDGGRGARPGARGGHPGGGAQPGHAERAGYAGARCERGKREHGEREREPWLRLPTLSSPSHPLFSPLLS